MGPRMRNKNAKLHLKGRIFMTNVTDILSMSKPGKYLGTVRSSTTMC